MIPAGHCGCVNGVSPIFLSGVYRSGTTLLTQIVAAHPELAITYDSVKFPRFSLGRYDPVDRPGNWRRLIRDTHIRLSRRWEMDFDVEDVNQAAANLDPVTYAGLYDALMTELLLRHQPDATRWGEKVAVMWTFIPTFLRMFPQGQAIHVFRDPRDVVASYKNMTYEPGLAYLDAAFNCLHAMYTVWQYRRDLGADRVMIVRMEDIAEAPQQQAANLCEFLGLSFDPVMIDPTHFRDKAGKTWNNNSAFQPDIQGISSNYTRWPELLSPEEVAFVELICSRWMCKFGYKPTGRVPESTQWNAIHEFFADPLISQRISRWFATGQGVESYPSDPAEPELKLLREALTEMGLADEAASV